MPAKAIPLPEWLPDQPGGLQVANNVFAIANGYAPAKALQQVVSSPGGGTFSGGGAFIDSTGNSSLIVATTGGIGHYIGGVWTGVIAFTNNVVNRFAQYGDNVYISVGPGAGGIVRADLIAGTMATVPDVSTPAAIDIAQTRDFVMVITSDNALQWCQFNDPLHWTTGTNQADKQPSLWGQLKRIVGGEYVIALTDRSVVRGSYVGVEGGLDIIWQFDEISQEVGCMAEGSVCNVGRLVFFLSERGFMMCDGNEVTPIADEKFNRWFFKTYARADIAKIWAAIDPRNSVVMWGMPGTPGKIIAYNWVLKRATTIEVNLTGMFSGYSSGTSLDGLDALYPGGIDTVPVSLDDPSLQGGNPVLLIADASSGLNVFTGDNLEATLRLDNIEPTPGKRSRIRELRLVSDTLDASATIDARMREGDVEGIRTAGSMRTNGKLPIRSNGRYNTVEVTIPAATDWSYIQGLELEFEAGDGR